MSIFRRGPEVGADSKIFKLPNVTEYEMQTGHSIMPESLRNAEKPTRLGAAVDLLRAHNEVE